MKTKLIFLAIPLLGLSACFGPTTENDGNAASTATLAKSVVGVRALSTDAGYDKPCHFLGEELVRDMFTVGEAEMTEHDLATGCSYAWSGNQVALTFAGARPFSSTFQAEYVFNKRYSAIPAVVAAAPVVADSVATDSAETAPAGAAPAEVAHAGVAHASETAHHAAPTPGGTYEPVAELGDKAAWNPVTNTMNVLYNNHILTVTVTTKDSAEKRKEHAKALAELMIEKLAEGEAYL